MSETAANICSFRFLSSLNLTKSVEETCRLSRSRVYSLVLLWSGCDSTSLQSEKARLSCTLGPCESLFWRKSSLVSWTRKSATSSASISDSGLVSGASMMVRSVGRNASSRQSWLARETEA